MDSQKEILDLLAVPQASRDQAWETNFLKKFPECKVTMMAQAPQGGPDHFPYMFVEIKEESEEPALNLLKWIAHNGVGLAVNPTKSFPDYVFTFGMIWNYFRSGQFFENPVPHVHGPNCNHGHDAPTPEQNKEGTELFVGSPSEGYLPPPVKAIMKEFLKQQGIMAPKITMVSVDKVNFDLCFSIESFGTPKQEEHEGILQSLSWFLPAHYSLAFVSENGIPSFEEL